MKKKVILTPLIGALCYFVLTGYPNGPGAAVNEDCTGASTTAGCSCHNASATLSTTVSLELDSAGVQVFKYIGGHSYTIKMTGTNTSSTDNLPEFGFQLAAVSTGTTTNEGTLSAITGAHVGTYTSSSISIVEHSTPLSPTTGTGGTGTTYVVNIPWTAPTSGTGCVTIYGVLNAVNGDGIDDAQDKWNNTSYTISEPAGAISGTLSVCTGGTTTLSESSTCGTWNSGSTSIATVGSSTGVVTGVSAGTSVITYTIGAENFATATVTVNGPPASISGTATVCAGSTTTLSDGSGSGTWASSSTSIASISSSTGIAAGVSAGTARITFTLATTGCYTTTTLTVNPIPVSISGASTACTGATGFLTDGTSGGVWSSSNTAVIGTGGSGVTAVGAGTATVTYSLASTGCYTTRVETVTPLPSAITGITNFCQGSFTTLNDASPGGTWSGGSGIASVSGIGAVTGVFAGTGVITYTLSGAGCLATTSFTVNPTPLSITGATSVCTGSSTTLNDASTGGTWVSGDASVAGIGSASGSVSGITTGGVTISYILPTGCLTTAPLTVNPLPAAITGTTSVCNGLTTDLFDGSAGGTWSSSNTAVANVNFIGAVTGAGAGTATITYQLPTGCYATITATVNPLPAAITGATGVCNGSSATLNDAVTGGTWISGNSTVVSIGSASGIVTGVATGSALITYELAATGCIATTHETVNPLPSAFTGSSLCAGSTTTLSDGTGGGSWSSGSAGVATIGSLSGLVTGVSAGTAAITYKLFLTGCMAADIETVNPLPSLITGSLSVCAGATTTLSDATSGGTWSSSNASATIGSGTGLATGVTTGTAIITYKLPATGCIATSTLSVHPSPAAISGTAGICTGGLTTLNDVTGAGTWSSGNTSVATIGTASGFVDGVAAGTSAVTFTLTSTGCPSFTTVTVNPLPGAITGVTTICNGQTTTLSDTSSGGVWSSGATAVATVGSGTGIVTTVAAGTATISYKFPTGCYSTSIVTINPLGPVAGLSSMCEGLSTTLTDAAGGGTWASSNTGVATINATTGLLSGISAGTTLITYSLATGCAATSMVTIVSTPSAITGNANICIGIPSALTDAGGGTWSSSNTGVATIGTTGVATGIISGTATITYSLGTGCTATIPVTVNPAPAAISGISSLCQGTNDDLSDVTTGGTWSSDNANATVGSTGIVTGVSPGADIITYTVGTGCIAVKMVTIDPLPSLISGLSGICAGNTTTLTDSASGGTWVSGSTSVATIVATSGLVSAVSAGTSIITYRLSTGCSITGILAVNPLPSAITGVAHVCVGATTDLSDGGGGSWSSGNANATIDSSSGVVTGVSSGTAKITYTLVTGCMVFTRVTVNPLPVVYTVTGGGGYCAGGSGVHIGLSGSATDASYQLYNGSSTARSAITGTGSVFDFGVFTVAGVYTVTATISATSCSVGMAGSVGVTIDPLPSSITGTTAVCAGLTTSLSDTTTSGSWSAGGSGATIGSGTGIVTGITAGTVIVTYTLPTSCIATATITINPLPGAITGSGSVCTGTATTLFDLTAGGAWSSGSTGIATITSGTGSVSGIASGTAAITYTLPTGCMISTAITVNPTPSGITGTAIICAGATTTLDDATPGGIWNSSSATTASVGSLTGVVTGITSGTAIIIYTLPTGCFTTDLVTINPLPSAISGVALVCDSAVFTDAATGGAWSSSNASVATAGSGSGDVTGIAAGTAILTYTLPTGCFITKGITVNFYPSAGSISGVTHQCGSGSTTLTDGVTGGTWSSSNTAVANVGSTGIVTGAGTGIATISYSVTNVCGTATASVADSVIAIPVADSILGADSVCAGDTLSLTTGVVIPGSWSSSNTAVATVSTSGTVTGIAGGTANISFTVTTECGSATAILALTVNPLSVCNAGVKPAPASAAIKVYPNPSTGSFTIDIPASATDATLTVTDISGKTIIARTIPGGNAQSLEFNLQNIASGSYIIKICSGDQTYRQVLEVIK